MTTVYRIYCGTDTNGFDVDATQIVPKLAAKYFPGGHTVYDAVGRWTGEGGVIDEPTIVVEFMTSDPSADEKKVSQFAGQVKNKTFQESVLITKTEVDAFFV